MLAMAKEDLSFGASKTLLQFFWSLGPSDHLAGLPQKQFAYVKTVDPKHMRITEPFNIKFGNACYELLHELGLSPAVAKFSPPRQIRGDSWRAQNLVYIRPRYDIESGTRARGQRSLSSLRNGPSEASGASNISALTLKNHRLNGVACSAQLNRPADSDSLVPKGPRLRWTEHGQVYP